jgi:agmatine deiminase
MDRKESTVVYVSDLLAGRFPLIQEGLQAILTEHGIGFGILHGTRDIWVRDFLPVFVDQQGSCVLFRYYPSYLVDGYQDLITDARSFVPGIPGIRSCENSSLILDGGNVVRCKGKAIVTDRVFAENPKIGREHLVVDLKRLLRVETLVVIPTEPGDVVGHADGVVRFMDEEGVLINDYRRLDRAYRTKLLKTLEDAGLGAIEIPYRPDLDDDNEIPSAVGNYVNFLQVDDLIVMPTYGLQEDRVAHRALTGAFPDKTIRTLPCRALAEEGGVLNCATWTISVLCIARDASQVVQSDQARG